MRLIKKVSFSLVMIFAAFFLLSSITAYAKGFSCPDLKASVDPSFLSKDSRFGTTCNGVWSEKRFCLIAPGSNDGSDCVTKSEYDYILGLMLFDSVNQVTAIQNGTLDPGCVGTFDTGNVGERLEYLCLGYAGSIQKSFDTVFTPVYNIIYSFINSWYQGYFPDWLISLMYIVIFFAGIQFLIFFSQKSRLMKIVASVANIILVVVTDSIAFTIDHHEPYEFDYSTNVYSYFDVYRGATLYTTLFMGLVIGITLFVIWLRRKRDNTQGSV